MSVVATGLKTRIAREVEFQHWRGTYTAKFSREDGFFLVNCWFENREPRMQIRAGANSLEEAMTVQVAIGMAIDWFVEQGVKA